MERERQMTKRELTEKGLVMEFLATAHRFKKIHMSLLFPEVSKGEFWTLKMIRDAGLKSKDECGVYVSTIAEQVRVTPSAISRMLKGLEERELIERKVDKNDRRNTYVTLTKKGEEVTQKIEDQMNEFTQNVMLTIGEEDSKTLVKLFNKLVDAMEVEVKQYKETEY